MDWHFEIRTRMLPNGRKLPNCVLIGENGVEVHMDYAKNWFIDYRSNDLEGRFVVSRDFRGKSEGEIRGARADEYALGPDCLVKLDVARLSRPLRPEDCPALAQNLKEVLRLQWKFPGARPPRIERVRFSDEWLQPFDD